MYKANVVAGSPPADWLMAQRSLLSASVLGESFPLFVPAP